MVANAVFGAVFFVEVPIPVPIDQTVRDSIVHALEGLGFAVCPAARCGDGAMEVVIVESGLNAKPFKDNPRFEAHVRARVKVRQNDGHELYSFKFDTHRFGPPDQAPQLLRACADAIAEDVRRTLLPRWVSSKVPLEDEGPLSPGVQMLQSSDWSGAIRFFTQLTQEQPELAGAWYDLGFAWEASGDWGRALAAYEQAVARLRSSTYVDALAVAQMQLARPAQPAEVPAQQQVSQP